MKAVSFVNSDKEKQIDYNYKPTVSAPTSASKVDHNRNVP